MRGEPFRTGVEVRIRRVTSESYMDNGALALTKLSDLWSTVLEERHAALARTKLNRQSLPVAFVEHRPF